MTRILIVEDNPDLAFGLKRSLEVEGFEVVIAGDGPTGVEQTRRCRPDLVILDVMLPGFDGYKVLSTIREQSAELPVLMLTARSDEPNKVHGFRLGADDYVTKPFGLSELLARVHALLRRAQLPGKGQAADPSVVEKVGDITVSPAARTVQRNGDQVQLTPKEFDLLVALIRRRGAVASRQDLLREVWGHRAEVTTRTVDMHIAELRRKLEDDPGDPKHILTVWKVGYRLEA